jgi:ABC-type transport system involved in multi-copper enzyme maturation permease subunit
MNYYLLQKEFIGLKLVLWLAVAICALDFLYIVATGFPDIAKEASQANASEEKLEDTVFNLMLFGMLIGVYLFGQEREHNTIPFLDGLPVRRTTLFFYKFLASCCVMVMIVVGLEVFDAFFAWLSSDSLSPEFHWKQTVTRIGVQFVLSYAVLGAATLVSFTRRWFPLIVGLILFVIVWIRSSGTWMSAWLDSPLMLRWSSGDGQSLTPWKPILGHLFIGTLGWMGSLIGFRTRDGFLSRQMERMAQWRIASWAVAFGQLAAAAIWFLTIASLMDMRDEPTIERLAAGDLPSGNDKEMSLAFDSFGRERTEYYEVVFRESQRQDVERFIGLLDILHEQVREFFDNPQAPTGKIVLDTSSPVVSHAAAQTNWTKIRFPLKPGMDVMDFFWTVRHETAHVYIEQLSGGRATDYFNAMRMFHEGLASLAEFSDNIQAETPQRLRKERWACGVDSRGRIPFHVLCDDDRLNELRDPDIVYPLGFVVAQAMVDAGGPSLPRRFLEALKVTPIPPRAKPSEVWRILLQKCDSSLDRVIAHYESRLNDLAQRERSFVEGLPRMTTNVSVEGDEIVVRVMPNRSVEISAVPLCMVERDRFIMKFPVNVAMTAPGEFRLPRSSILGNQIRLLVGWQSPESEGAIYEPWQEIKLKK